MHVLAAGGVQMHACTVPTLYSNIYLKYQNDCHPSCLAAVGCMGIYPHPASYPASATYTTIATSTTNCNVCCRGCKRRNGRLKHTYVYVAAFCYVPLRKHFLPIVSFFSGDATGLPCVASPLAAGTRKKEILDGISTRHHHGHV